MSSEYTKKRWRRTDGLPSSSSLRRNIFHKWTNGSLFFFLHLTISEKQNKEAFLTFFFRGRPVKKRHLDSREHTGKIERNKKTKSCAALSNLEIDSRKRKITDTCVGGTERAQREPRIINVAPTCVFWHPPTKRAGRALSLSPAASECTTESRLKGAMTFFLLPSKTNRVAKTGPWVYVSTVFAALLEMKTFQRESELARAEATEFLAFFSSVSRSCIVTTWGKSH